MASVSTDTKLNTLAHTSLQDHTHTHTHSDTHTTHTDTHTHKHNPCYVQLLVKWNSKQFTLTVDVANRTNTMLTVKHMLAGLTMVECKRQKLIGLKHKGREPADNIPLCDIKKFLKYISMMKVPTQTNKNKTMPMNTHTHTHTKTLTKTAVQQPKPKPKRQKPVKLLLIGSPASEYITTTPLNLPYVENDLDFSYDTKECKGILDKARLEQMGLARRVYQQNAHRFVASEKGSCVCLCVCVIIIFLIYEYVMCIVVYACACMYDVMCVCVCVCVCVGVYLFRKSDFVII